MITLEFNTIEQILLACAGILLITQIIYYLVLYNRIYRRNKDVDKGKYTFARELPPISVIVCAKNQIESLREYLPAILEQDYPKYEVIVIDDSSTDETDDYLTLLQDKYPHLYHSFTPDSARYISHKKLAVMLGIKASKYDWLVFTEPNCQPAGANWLRMMARNFTPDTEIVLGYSGFKKGKGWFHKKVSFDSLFTSIRALGFALTGKPYTGCGRNMAYRKELFYSSKGFSEHLNLQRGEDDLFVNKVANKKNTRVETSPEAVVWMEPLRYKKDWKEQKISYAATSSHYKGGQKYMLGAETFSRLLFYGVIVGGITYSILSHNWIMAGILLILWLIRFVVQSLVINKTIRSIGEKHSFHLSLPVFDILQPLQTLKFRILRNMRGKSDFFRK